MSNKPPKLVSVACIAAEHGPNKIVLVQKNTPINLLLKNALLKLLLFLLNILAQYNPDSTNPKLEIVFVGCKKKLPFAASQNSPPIPFGIPNQLNFTAIKKIIMVTIAIKEVTRKMFSFFNLLCLYKRQFYHLRF